MVFGGIMEQLEDHLWLISQPFKLGVANIGLNSSIVKLSDGSLVLIAPGRISPEQKVKIDALGPVKHLIAPNLWHHLFLAKAKALFPEAKIYRPDGLEKKQPKLNFSASLSESIDFPWLQDLGQYFIAGMPLVNEYNFYHKESKTLIVTDAFFNVQCQQGLLGTMLLKTFGTYKRPTCSKLFRFMIKDKAAFKQSIYKIMELDVERLIMSHGEVLHRDGKRLFREAYEPLLAKI